MIALELHDDGFLVEERGKYRLRVNPMHEGRAIYAVRRRRLRESEMWPASPIKGDK